MRKTLLIHPEELTKKWIDRMAEHRVDTIGLHPTGGPLAYQSMERLVQQFDDPTFCGLLDYAASKGLTVEYECHASEYLLERDLFKTHPEWFRLDEEGNRNPEQDFCFSNEDAMEYVMDRAVTLYKKLYHSLPNCYFWLGDHVKNKNCNCPTCAQYSNSDQQLRFLNRLVKALRTVDPAACVAYLAYHNYITPPTQIKPEDGVFLEYAPIDRNFAEPVSAMPQEEIDNITKLMEFFGKKHSRVLEYWYDNSYFSKWKKPPKQFIPNAELIQNDIKFYEGLGFEEITSFACFLGDDYEELYGEPDISAFTK